MQLNNLKNDEYHLKEKLKKIEYYCSCLSLENQNLKDWLEIKKFVIPKETPSKESIEKMIIEIQNFVYK